MSGVRTLATTKKEKVYCNMYFETERVFCIYDNRKRINTSQDTQKHFALTVTYTFFNNPLQKNLSKRWST